MKLETGDWKFKLVSDECTIITCTQLLLTSPNILD